MTTRRRAEGGFTLLEVIVAMALFAAGIVAVYRLYAGSLRLAAGSRDATASAIYARQRMEEALLAPNPVEGVERGSFGDRYRWELETAFLPREEERPYDGFRVRVTVTWADGGNERSVDLFATRWGWKEGDAGDLSGGPTWRQPGSVSQAGGSPGAGGGGPPGAGSGGSPGAGGGGKRGGGSAGGSVTGDDGVDPADHSRGGRGWRQR